MNSNGDVICDICVRSTVTTVVMPTPMPKLFDAIQPNSTSAASEEDNVPAIVTINEAKMHTIRHEVSNIKGTYH